MPWSRRFCAKLQPMPWIEIPGDEDDAEVARATRTWRRQGVPVPGVVAPMKIAPRTLRAVMQMNAAVTFGGSVLGRLREELVATTVSLVDECFY